MKAEWTNSDSLTTSQTTKAILVIDAPDDFDAKKIKIGGDGNIYYKRDGERASIIGNMNNFKPMPIRQQMTLARGVATNEAYIEGWNECLEEILNDSN